MPSFAKLEGCQYLSKIYFKCYHQISVAPEAKDKLSFSTPLGHYDIITYLVMPCGLKVQAASATG